MGEKDITEKILEDYNDVFADIINGLLFHGEQRVLPEALENISVHSAIVSTITPITDHRMYGVF